MRDRLRHLAPPSGRQYELFDTCVLLLALGLLGYVIFPPTPTLEYALSAPLEVVSERQLGWALCALSAAGVVCSYRRAWTDTGYRIGRIAAAFMCLTFLLVLLAITADLALGLWGVDALPDTITAEPTVRASFLYAFVYGWAARRLARDNTRW